MTELMPKVPGGYSIAAELQPYVSELPTLDLDDLEATRRLLTPPESTLKERTPGVDMRHVVVPLDEIAVAPGADEHVAALELLLYMPSNRRAPGAVLDIHGGGFVLGSAAGQHAWNARLCRELGVVVASVDYRLAPEHPFPAALVDCDAAFSWLIGQSSIDPRQVAIVGSSAGACLATGVSLWRRDRGVQGPHFQYLAIPVLDDRLNSGSMLRFTDTPVWDRARAEKSWALYLSGEQNDLLPYAAPGRRTDLAGLPSTYLSVMEFDPLRDEGISFAAQLLSAGVPTELHLFPGTFHTSHRIEDAAVSARDWTERLTVLRAALGLKGV